MSLTEQLCDIQILLTREDCKISGASALSRLRCFVMLF